MRLISLPEREDCTNVSPLSIRVHRLEMFQDSTSGVINMQWVAMEAGKQLGDSGHRMAGGKL